MNRNDQRCNLPHTPSHPPSHPLHHCSQTATNHASTKQTTHPPTPPTPTHRLHHPRRLHHRRRCSRGSDGRQRRRPLLHPPPFPRQPLHQPSARPVATPAHSVRQPQRWREDATCPTCPITTFAPTLPLATAIVTPTPTLSTHFLAPLFCCIHPRHGCQRLTVKRQHLHQSQRQNGRCVGGCQHAADAGAGGGGRGGVSESGWMMKGWCGGGAKAGVVREMGWLSHLIPSHLISHL